MSALEEQALRAVDEEQPPTWTERLAAQLKPWSKEELDAAKDPHPHVFRGYERAMFPLREVTVLGARGREGKTTILVALATAIAIEHSLAGLRPMEGRSVVIYSAEDDRAQLARKVAAQRAMVAPSQIDQLMKRVIVPDLEAPGMEPLRRLVTAVHGGVPMSTGAEAAIIEAIRPLMRGEHPPALLMFETAATLTETDEDNRAFSVLVGQLKAIARALEVAVGLTHHTSQVSDATLADLSINATAIRGGTALIYNSRQNLLLVNLGSESDPFPENDARTVLRELVAPGCTDRTTALLSFDTSKAADPAPIWFRWAQTEYDPAAVELDPPEHLDGMAWRRVREMVVAERASRKNEAKAEREDATLGKQDERALQALAREMQLTPGQPVTKRRIRGRACMSDAVADRALERLVGAGTITSQSFTSRGKLTTGYILANGGTGD